MSCYGKSKILASVSFSASNSWNSLAERGGLYLKTRFSHRTALLSVLVVLVGIALLVASPFSHKSLWRSIVDPDESHFQFDRYRSEAEFQAKLESLFPPGTHRDRVDTILVDQSDLSSAYTSGGGGNYYIEYFDPARTIDSLGITDSGVQQVQVEYDTADVVVSIKSHILDGKTPPKFFIGDSVVRGGKQ